jgi:Fur family ferric uptake transcriptional regulator/Fur family peroxide stress response transcriptional regulator
MKTLLKEQGLKVTPQRLALLDLIEEHGHISIEELYELLIEDFPSLSLATIYKNMIIMTNSGILKEIKIDNAKSKFEIIKDDHIHFICSCCGAIEDKHPTAELKSAFDTIASSENFSFNDYNLNLYGKCTACSTNEKISA